MFSSLQSQIIFPREHARPLPRTHLENLPNTELWAIESEEGDVEALFLLGEGRTPDSPGAAVVFAHGNAELIDYYARDVFAPYIQAGVSVLLPEYRGYGRSAGNPSESAIQTDFVAFYDRLAQRREVDANRIFYHGRSLGGGAVCALMQERKPRGLILQSTFTSIPDVARRMWVPGFIIEHPFRNDEAIKAAMVPLLVFHGKHDEVIPFSHGKRLSQMGYGDFIEWELGHNDTPPTSGSRAMKEEYWSRVLDFVTANGQ